MCIRDRYLEVLDQRARAAAAAAGGPVQALGVGAKGAAPAGAEEGGLSNKELRELKKKRTSVERKLGTARSKLEKAQGELQGIDGYDYAALIAQQAKIDELKDQLEQLEDEWLELSEQLGE